MSSVVSILIFLAKGPIWDYWLSHVFILLQSKTIGSSWPWCMFSTVKSQWPKCGSNSSIHQQMSRSTKHGYSAFKRKEILTHTTTWMNLQDIIPSEASQTQNDDYCMCPFMWGIQSSQNHRNGRAVAARGWVERAWGAILDRCQASVLQDEKEVDAGDSYTMLWVHRGPWTERLRMAKMANFMFYLFCHNV